MTDKRDLWSALQVAATLIEINKDSNATDLAHARLFREASEAILECERRTLRGRFKQAVSWLMTMTYSRLRRWVRAERAEAGNSAKLD